MNDDRFKESDSSGAAKTFLLVLGVMLAIAVIVLVMEGLK